MTSRTYPDNLNDTFSYDNASRLTLANSGRYSNSVARVYDSASRLTVETLSVGAASYNLGYGYDADNRQTAVIYPSGDVVTRSFTDRNQLSSVSFNNVAVANLSYDDGRRLSTKSFGNGIVENRTYRNDNLIASIATAGVDTFTYSWDANKRKLSQSETGIPTNNQTYSYDSEDRLTNFARTNGDAQSWNLSLVGDWNSFNKNGILENRTHNAVHELTAVNATPLTYDVKGNITQNSNGQFYTWDVENRLTLAIDGFNTLATYTYDALGRRTSKTVAANTTTFVSDGLQEVAEYVNGALTQSYVYGSYIDEPLMMVKANGDKFYYHANDLYSVAALTDNNGNVVERYKYDPYGKATILAADGVTVLGASSVGNRRLHQGLPLDLETGLYDNKARMLDPNLGRFISRDPIGYMGSKWNLYEYLSGSPMRNLDPEGLKILDIPCYKKCMDAHEADFMNRKLNITQDQRRNIWSPGCVTKCQIDAPWGDCPIDAKDATGADCSASGGIDAKGRPNDLDKTFVFGDCCKRTCKCTKFFVSFQPPRADGSGGRPGNAAEYHWRNDGTDAACIAKNQAAQTVAESAAIQNAILPAK